MTQVNVQLTDGTVRPAPVDYVPFTVVTPAAAQVITANNVKTIRHIKSCQIEATTGIRRVPTGAITFTGNVVTVANSSFLTGEIVHLEVVGYNS
ncbi:hypothetical protein GFL93_09380 [Rhizobium leguminosarum bv. viciae]|uniref:hypothetical protein n=1 Tax=Rhizobium TaxID=379 RepID=UPI0010309143|nr:hypothetical protein [Rhizobium leguminosarum]NKK06082.1 hypothetical protein [Rhizobium leguminosarum bv. viciae]TBH23637.1 hypothetical protein ELG64_09030 [Rhizobium leguminosarum]